MSDYIKLHRKFLEWEWYRNEHTKNLFIHCLLKANWKESKFEGNVIQRGSFVSSIDILASETGLTSDEVRTAIKHLISTGELTKQSTNKYTVFSVVNYDLYQPVSQAEPKQAPSYSQSIPNNRRNKEYKEINNICAPEPHDRNFDKEDQLKKDFEIIYGIYPKKKGKTVAFANYKQWVSEKGKDVGGKRYHLTNRQIYIAVKKYIRQQEEAGQDDLQYWKNFDTLMGRQLLDYVEVEDGKNS